MSYAERAAQLQRMIAAARETKGHLEKVRNRISQGAILYAAAHSGTERARTFKSVTSYWAKRDHEVRRDMHARLEEAARNELGALEARLGRQAAAIDAFCRRHGINEEVRI